MYEMNKILQQLGMSFKEFSEHYEIPYNTVRQWAQGTRKPPAYVIRLLNEKIERETKGKQLKIDQKIEYFCYSIDKKGLTGVFHGKFIDSVERWKNGVKKRNEKAWIEEKITINEYNVN